MNKDRTTLALLTAFFRCMPDLLAAGITPERAAAEASAFLQINEDIKDIKDSAALFLSGNFGPDPSMSVAKRFALTEYFVALANNEPRRVAACLRVVIKFGHEWAMLFMRGLNTEARVAAQEMWQSL